MKCNQWETWQKIVKTCRYPGRLLTSIADKSSVCSILWMYGGKVPFYYVKLRKWIMLAIRTANKIIWFLFFFCFFRFLFSLPLQFYGGCKQTMGLDFFETSAKTGYMIQQSIVAMAAKLQVREKVAIEKIVLEAESMEAETANVGGKDKAKKCCRLWRDLTVASVFFSRVIGWLLL